MCSCSRERYSGRVRVPHPHPLPGLETGTGLWTGSKTQPFVLVLGPGLDFELLFCEVSAKSH